MVNKKEKSVVVLGDGGWGTTLSILLAKKGYRVFLWGAFAPYLKEIEKTRENTKFLPGFKLPENIVCQPNLAQALESSELVVLAVPSAYLRSVIKKIDRLTAKKKIWINVAKGIEVSSLKTMSQVIEEVWGSVRLAVVSGPTIARDVALMMPSAATVASKDKKVCSVVRDLLSTDYFKLYECYDIRGVELGGSIKNVIAIGAGILQGLNLGANTRALLFARGVAEMARLGLKLGAKRETFMGLSGLGDLATTCLSPHSRNRSLGEQIGHHKTLKQALKESPMVVEGVETSKALIRLAKKHRVHMPISQAVYKILFENKQADLIVGSLLDNRTLSEIE